MSNTGNLLGGKDKKKDFKALKYSKYLFLSSGRCEYLNMATRGRMFGGSDHTKFEDKISGGKVEHVVGLNYIIRLNSQQLMPVVLKLKS